MKIINSKESTEKMSRSCTIVVYGRINDKILPTEPLTNIQHAEYDYPEVSPEIKNIISNMLSKFERSGKDRITRSRSNSEKIIHLNVKRKQTE